MAKQDSDQQYNYGRLDVAVRSLLSPSDNGRTENQDNYLLVDCAGRARFLRDQQEQTQRLARWPEGHSRYAVLDGMGGHSHGRQAAEFAVQGLLEMPATANLGALSDHLERLHQRLHRQMHVDGAEPGCTLTLLEVPPVGPTLLFHVGDSRLYTIDSEQVDYLTVDHIPATRFAMLHLLNAEEWYRQTHELPGYQISQAFILGNSLGGAHFYEKLDAGLFELHDGNLPPFLQSLGDRRTMELQRDRVYLLSSDGLWHLQQPSAFVNRWPKLLGAMRKPLAPQLDSLFKELIQTTRSEPQTRGDNCTAIAFRLC